MNQASGSSTEPHQERLLMNPSSANPTLRCALCYNPPAVLCSECESAAYCSEFCKNRDSRYHQVFCPDFKKFLNKGRPVPEARLAILFSDTSQKPELTWIVDQRPVLLERRSRSDGKLYKGLYVGDSDRCYEIRTVAVPTEGSWMDHTVSLCCREEFETDICSFDTVSLYEFMNGENRRAWKGPILLISQHAPGKPSGFHDITLSDLRVFRAFLVRDGQGLEESLQSNKLRYLELHAPLTWEAMLQRFAPKDTALVKGVLINCESDKDVLGKPLYSEVEVPVNHPIFLNEKGAIQISVKLGFPLLFRRTAHDPRLKGRYTNLEEYEENITTTNEAAELLATIIDVDSNKWGISDLGSDKTIESGTILVVREDKMKLSADHIRTLVAWIEKYFMTAIEEKRATELNKYVCSDTMIRNARDRIVNTTVTWDNIRKYYATVWGKPGRPLPGY